MSPRRRPDGFPENPRLYVRSSDEPPSLWTQALGEPPQVHRERTLVRGSRTFRRWEPGRSKLGAALAKGWRDPFPAEGERWLYLGASTGTTASHIADLVGPTGRVYAVERSVRPFARLLALARRYPNLLPVLGDARRPADYAGSVPPVDAVYVDVAQPDQAEIARANARLYLRASGKFLLALKTSSMGRGREPRRHLAEAVGQLVGLELEPGLDLGPFHRRHFFLGGRPTRSLFRPAADAEATDLEHRAPRPR